MNAFSFRGFAAFCLPFPQGSALMLSITRMLSPPGSEQWCSVEEKLEANRQKQKDAVKGVGGVREQRREERCKENRKVGRKREEKK